MCFLLIPLRSSPWSTQHIMLALTGQASLAVHTPPTEQLKGRQQLLQNSNSPLSWVSPFSSSAKHGQRCHLSLHTAALLSAVPHSWSVLHTWMDTGSITQHTGLTSSCSFYPPNLTNTLIYTASKHCQLRYQQHEVTHAASKGNFSQPALREEACRWLCSSTSRCGTRQSLQGQPT